MYSFFEYLYKDHHKVQVVPHITKEAANHGSQMNHMSWLVFFKEILRRYRIPKFGNRIYIYTI